MQVRSSCEYLDMDLKHRLGFVSNPKRFNVSLTRAKVGAAQFTAWARMSAATKLISWDCRDLRALALDIYSR